MKNTGELPQYFVKNAHDAIIDQETFDRVQEELKRRAELYDYGCSVIPHEERHPLSTKITCGVCGKHFIRRFANSSSKYKAPIWVCQTYLRHKKEACASRRISEKVLFPILGALLIPQGVNVVEDEEKLLSEMSRIDEIVVFPDGRLTVRIDGESHDLHWENASRALSWTPEMKQKAREAEMKRAREAEMRRSETQCRKQP